MKITGIVVEYNPMHQGHLYHIQQAREMTSCDFLVAVMSPHFVQRGEIACIDKFSRAKAALENGVDLVLELPTVFACQSAQTFSDKAVAILAMAGVDTIVFGSESNDIETLKTIANYPVNIDYFKELMRQGYSYPMAINAASDRLYPNDILGVGYCRAAQKYGLKVASILRTNHYHDESLDQAILSASAIRKARANNIETNQSLVTLEDFVEAKDVYPFLRYQILSSKPSGLRDTFLISEGIEHLLYENAKEHDNYEDFMQACISRRYSRARIGRICVHILLQHTEKDIANLSNLNFIRILGFRKKATVLLKKIKSSSTIVASKVKEMPQDYFDIEMNATLIYSLITKRKDLISQEIGPVIII